MNETPGTISTNLMERDDGEREEQSIGNYSYLAKALMNKDRCLRFFMFLIFVCGKIAV